jgi:hypothetical protein
VTTTLTIPAVLLARHAQRGFTQFEDHELRLFMSVKNLLATIASTR